MASTESSNTIAPKLFKRNEVLETKDGKDTFIIIHNNVYNVTAFLNEVFKKNNYIRLPRL